LVPITAPESAGEADASRREIKPSEESFMPIAGRRRRLRR
jgi:hypothetical protein